MTWDDHETWLECLQDKPFHDRYPNIFDKLISQFLRLPHCTSLTFRSEYLKFQSSWSVPIESMSSRLPLGADSIRIQTFGESQQAPMKLVRLLWRMSLIALTSNRIWVLAMTESLSNIFMATSAPFHLPWLRTTFLWESYKRQSKIVCRAIFNTQNVCGNY